MNYSGHTRPAGSPAGGVVATDAGYFALDMEGNIGWRFPAKEYAAIPFLGVGFRWRFRDIGEATAIDNAGVTRGRFRAAGFYEGMNFKDLDPRTTAGILGTSPLGFRTESESRTYGLRIGVVF